MKLNAEELAAKRFPYAIPGVMDDVERRRQKNTYAAAITEVAQPLQDRVEELEAALMRIAQDHHCAPRVNGCWDAATEWQTRRDIAKAILAKQK